MDANSTFKNTFCKFTTTGPVPITINMVQVLVATDTHVYLSDGTSYPVIESFKDAFTAQHGSDAFFSTFATLTTADAGTSCYNGLVTAANITIYVPYSQISHVAKNFVGSGVATAKSLVFGPGGNLAVKESPANFNMVDGYRQFTIRTSGAYGNGTCNFTAVAADAIYVNLEYVTAGTNATDLFLADTAGNAIPVIEAIVDQIGAN